MRRPDDDAAVERVRSMRRVDTDAERRLRRALRGRRLANAKFRRQVWIGPFIADFLCADARLIVEVDGSQHAESEADRRRTIWLEREGFRVLRFWNNQVLEEMDGVLMAIGHALTLPTACGGGPLPSPLQGEGS